MDSLPVIGCMLMIIEVDLILMLMMQVLHNFESGARHVTWRSSGRSSRYR